MCSLTDRDYETLASAFAFLGNSLLEPMTKTPDVGLKAEFWKEFPTFGDAEVEAALDGMALYAQDAEAHAGGDAPSTVEVCAYEFTRLFAGPPHPQAAPWESAYLQNGDVQKRGVVGFGEATHEMRRLLREVGLELHNQNHQYEDHMGIELLFLSELCERASAGEPGFDGQRAAGFAKEHPLAWIDALAAKVHEAAPDGYFDNLLKVAKALLEAVAC